MVIYFYLNNSGRLRKRTKFILAENARTLCDIFGEINSKNLFLLHTK